MNLATIIYIPSASPSLPYIGTLETLNNLLTRINPMYTHLINLQVYNFNHTLLRKLSNFHLPTD